LKFEYPSLNSVHFPVVALSAVDRIIYPPVLEPSIRKNGAVGYYYPSSFICIMKCEPGSIFTLVLPYLTEGNFMSFAPRIVTSALPPMTKDEPPVN